VREDPRSRGSIELAAPASHDRFSRWHLDNQCSLAIPVTVRAARCHEVTSLLAECARSPAFSPHAHTRSQAAAVVLNARGKAAEELDGIRPR